jgi:murein DD-endopeptidase MepM/ murein hydrolase activator NlpD
MAGARAVSVTTRFGDLRSYNGGPVSGHHSGTDLGADLSTPVVATNSGRVVMARQLRVHGNMVIIDHGGGVYSVYAHLSSFAAAEGQVVSAGDIIGYVGNTGLSTGAHLHWEMSVGGVLVDPMKFSDGSGGF